MSYVLLIEPNALLAKTYTKAMEDAGHRVVHCTGAQAAILAADAHAPDIVVLELQMPLHNGIEFLQEFRSYPEWKQVPVIVNTTIPPARLGERGRAALQRDLNVHRVTYKPRTSLARLLRLVREYTA